MIKQCQATCRRALPLSEFPANKQYGELRHPYCRKCCREKMAAHRKTLKEMVQRKASVIWKAKCPAEKVIYAIRKGKHTQREIARYARLSGDELGEVLVDLVLDRRRVTSEWVNGERRYFERLTA